MDRRRFLQRTAAFAGIGLTPPITSFAAGPSSLAAPVASSLPPFEKHFDTPLKFVEYVSVVEKFRSLHRPWDVSGKIGGDYSPQIGDTFVYSAKYQDCAFHILLRPSRGLPREDTDATVSPPRTVLIPPPEDRTGLVDMAIYVTFDRRRSGLRITPQERAFL